MAEAARVVYRLPPASRFFFFGQAWCQDVLCGRHGNTADAGRCRQQRFWLCCRPLPGEAFYDLSTVPQRRLLPLASFWNDGFYVHARGVPSVAVSYVRPKVLFLAGRAELFPFRPLPTMREFRSGTYFARPRGRWDDDVGEALPALPCLPLRSLPGAVLQHPASPKNPSLHGTRSREQRPRDGGWRKLILYRRSTCLLFGAAPFARGKFPLVTQN